MHSVVVEMSAQLQPGPAGSSLDRVTSQDTWPRCPSPSRNSESATLYKHFWVAQSQSGYL